jgi:hypothetical protein
MKPLLALFHGEPGGHRYRTALSTLLQGTTDVSVASLTAATEEALQHIPRDVQDQRF